MCQLSAWIFSFVISLISPQSPYSEDVMQIEAKDPGWGDSVTCPKEVHVQQSQNSNLSLSPICSNILLYSQAKKANKKTKLFFSFGRNAIYSQYIVYPEVLRLCYCLRGLFHQPSSVTATWFSPGNNLSEQVTPVISIWQLCVSHHLSHPSVFLSKKSLKQRDMPETRKVA